MASLVLKVSIEWEESAGDCSPCKICKDPIFFKMHTLVIKSGPVVEKTNIKLCDNCFTAINE